MNSTIYYTIMPSPVDDLLLVSDGTALTRLSMQETRGKPVEIDAAWKREPGPFRETVRQLTAYFEGELRTFDLPIRVQGTDFQHTVWAALQKLRHGERVSYAELARRIGRPTASRAVGLANGRNRIGIIIPCHRVIATGGKLGGYGGGLGRKQWLLEHEASRVEQSMRPGAWTLTPRTGSISAE